MLKYNLYYDNEKLNKTPLSTDELDKIKQLKTVNKYNEETKQINVIPTESIKIVKCYVI